MSTIFAESESLLVGNYSQPFGLGFECELVQRAAKAQILKYLPGLTSQLQNIWDERDKEFIEVMGGSYKRIRIPKVEKENILSGIEVISLIEALIDRWPAILIYARNGSAYQIQEDQFDMLSVSLNIEILCSAGPVNSEEVHGKEGLLAMQELDSQIQRLSDAVYLCIQKDKTLSGSVGQIEKPPKSITSAPWARKKEKTATGESYIFQGKQFDFTIQKPSI